MTKKVSCEPCLNAHDSKSCLLRSRCVVTNSEEQHKMLLYEPVQIKGEEFLTNNYASRKSGTPFRIVSATTSYGQKTTPANIEESSATVLVLLTLTHSAGAIVLPESSGMSCTAGVTREVSSSRQINLVISRRGGSRQNEFVHTRYKKQLSLLLHEQYFTKLIHNFAHFQGLSILPFLKGESRSTIGTQQTDPMSNYGDPTAERSRLRSAFYGFGSFRRSTIGTHFRWRRTQNIVMRAHIRAKVRLKNEMCRLGF